MSKWKRTHIEAKRTKVTEARTELFHPREITRIERIFLQRLSERSDLTLAAKAVCGRELASFLVVTSRRVCLLHWARNPVEVCLDLLTQECTTFDQEIIDYRFS